MVDSRLVERLQACQRILVVSGAGVSTASGIPDSVVLVVCGRAVVRCTTRSSSLCDQPYAVTDYPERLSAAAPAASF